jgi:hypothetical protein
MSRKIKYGCVQFYVQYFKVEQILLLLLLNIQFIVTST